MTTYSYNFIEYPNISFQDGFDQYLSQNLGSLVYNGLVFDNDKFIIVTNNTLSNLELNNLNTLIHNYTPLPYILIYNSSRTLAMYGYNNDINVVYDDEEYSIIQFNVYKQDNELIIDGIKATIELNCLNVQNYLNTTSGSLNLKIFDYTNNTLVTQQTININSDITTLWNQLAQNGNTNGNSAIQNVSFDSLSDIISTDSIYNFGTKSSDDKYIPRLRGLQCLYYNKIINPDV